MKHAPLKNTHPMQADSQIRSIAAVLADLRDDCLRPTAITEQNADRNTAPATITIGALAAALHERGTGMVLLLFALPMALPVPVPPGVNIALASPLIFLTAQQALGRQSLWLPQKILRREIRCDKLSGLIDRMIPFLDRISCFIKPRLGFLTHGAASRLFGFCGLLMALSVCVPIPLTNTIPSLGIAMMAIGTMMRDGLAVLAGAAIGLAWIALLGGMALVFGPEAFTIIKETIKAVLP